MDGTWRFLVSGERVEIHEKSSCGTFFLSALPHDWLRQFLLPEVRAAILAELTARKNLVWPERRQPAEDAEPDSRITLSWYSIRARLLPATRAPITCMGTALDGRGNIPHPDEPDITDDDSDKPADAMPPPLIVATELAISA